MRRFPAEQPMKRTPLSAFDATNPDPLKTPNFHNAWTDQIRTNDNHLLGDYCDRSTCAGVVDLHKAPNLYAKSFWTMVIFGALTLTAFQTYQTVVAYIDENGRFQSVIKSKQMPSNFQFPNVTVCNFNRANVTKLALDNVHVGVMEYAYGASPIVYDFAYRTLEHMPNFANRSLWYESLWTNFSRDFYGGREPDIKKLIRTYGHDCTSTFVRVVFNGADTNRDNCYNAIETITTYGRCWTYMSTTQSVPGPSMGLQMTLNAATYEYPIGSLLNNYMEQGLVLMIDYVQEAYASNPIVIKPGGISYVALSVTSETFTDQLFPVFRLPCRRETELKFIHGDYSPLNCQADCMANLTWTLYGCVSAPDPKPLYRQCSPNETVHLITPLYDAGVKYLTEHIPPNMVAEKNHCQHMCQPKCEKHTTVTPTVTTNVFSLGQSRRAVEELFQMVMAGRFDKATVEDIIRVNIYFPVLQMLEIEITESTPVFTFIGNVGGQLGLWAGLSILSLIQIIYYLVYAILRCSSSRQNKVQHRVEPIATDRRGLHRIYY